MQIFQFLYFKGHYQLSKQTSNIFNRSSNLDYETAILDTWDMMNVQWQKANSL